MGCVCECVNATVCHLSVICFGFVVVFPATMTNDVIKQNESEAGNNMLQVSEVLFHF